MPIQVLKAAVVHAHILPIVLQHIRICLATCIDRLLNKRIHTRLVFRHEREEGLGRLESVNNGCARPVECFETLMDMNHERDLGVGTGKAECGRFVIGPELDVVEVEGDEEDGCFFEIYGWEIDDEGRGVGDTGFGGHGDRPVGLWSLREVKWVVKGCCVGVQ